MPRSPLNRALLLAHRWLGLAAAAFLLVLAGTGAVLLYQPELERALQPALRHVIPGTQRVPLDSVVAAARRANPGGQVRSIALPEAADDAVRVRFGGVTAYVDPWRGTVLGLARPGRVVARLRLLHRALLVEGRGLAVTRAATWAAVLLTVGGLALWWRRRVWWLVRTGSWRGVVFDLHNVAGLLATPGILLFAGTAALMSVSDVLDPLYRRVLGDAGPVPLAAAAAATGATLPLDSLVRLADAAVPGPVREVRMPQGPASPLQVLQQAPGQRGPRARNATWIDPHDGRIRGVADQAARPLGSRLSAIIEDWHVGGIPVPAARAFGVASCALLAFQVLSGTLVWWRPRRRQEGREDEG